MVSSATCRTAGCRSPAIARGWCRKHYQRWYRTQDAVAPKTHCKHGHELTPENTYTTPQGGRECRECRRVRVREYLRRKRAEAKASG